MEGNTSTVHTQLEMHKLKSRTLKDFIDETHIQESYALNVEEGSGDEPLGLGWFIFA